TSCEYHAGEYSARWWAQSDARPMHVHDVERDVRACHCRDGRVLPAAARAARCWGVFVPSTEVPGWARVLAPCLWKIAVMWWLTVRSERMPRPARHGGDLRAVGRSPTGTVSSCPVSATCGRLSWRKPFVRVPRDRATIPFERIFQVP